ncbi:MAG: hypothetical protein Q9201_000544 [Fulgogasparrea decipioides]
MARIKFRLSPGATLAAIANKVTSNKKVKQASFITKSKRKAKSKKAAYSRLRKRPLIIQWLHLMAIDVSKMVGFFGVATILRYVVPHYRLQSFSWPMWPDPVEHLWRGPESISRPSRSIMSLATATAILSLSPLAILGLMQILVQNFWDFNAAMTALLTVVDIVSTPSIIVLSALIGIAAGFMGYRSHFHSVFDYHDNHLPFLQGPDKPRPKLPLHHLHLPLAIQSHLPSHIHAPHLNLHMPHLFHHRSAEEKRQEEEKQWLARNFKWPEQLRRKGKDEKRKGKRRRRPSAPTRVDTGVLMAEVIGANILDAGAGLTDAMVGAAAAG